MRDGGNIVCCAWRCASEHVQDFLSRFDIGSIPDKSALYWVHAGFVWCLVKLRAYLKQHCSGVAVGGFGQGFCKAARCVYYHRVGAALASAWRGVFAGSALVEGSGEEVRMLLALHVPRGTMAAEHIRLAFRMFGRT